MNISIKKHTIVPDPITGETLEVIVNMIDLDSGRVHTQGLDSTDWDKTIEQQCNIAMTAFEELLLAESSTETPTPESIEEPIYKPVETVFE